MQRKCGYEPLAAQPLVLVLCQVRFSPARQMERYIPAIQDVFQRNGFPIEKAGKVHQVTFGLGGSAPVEVVEQERWEYRNREETWSILVMQDSVILQTTAYTRFEEFAGRLQLAIDTVLSYREQGPHSGRRTPRRDGCTHCSKQPGLVAPSRSHGRRAEPLVKGRGRRVGHLDRHGPLR